MKLEEIQKLIEPAETKILFLVLDGLGGLPEEVKELTALEAAQTPHLDRLANEGICGLHVPVYPGITPGSGPSHLGLFGYDPLQYQVGRGVLSALGIDFDLQPGDVAARGNFCTVDSNGKVADRRAGRIKTEKNRELISLLEKIKIDNVEVIFRTVKEYRFLLVLRGENLSGDLDDTDPQETGAYPENPRALTPEAEKTAKIVTEVINQAQKILMDQQPANMILLRGFSQKPDWPKFPEVFGLKAAAIAAYPMYRGVTKLLGMEPLGEPGSFKEEIDVLREYWDEYDFFYIHKKKIDSHGEDGNYKAKMNAIEEVDQYIPDLLDLEPDVFLVTGDHSTPTRMRSHSWHTVPVLLWSKYCRRDDVSSFGERACIQGGLGANIPSKYLMPIALANSGRLEKFGA